MFNVAMASYLEEEYEEILQISADSDKLDSDWNTWRLKSAKRVKQMEQMGMKVERIIIHPKDLLDYCKKHRLEIIGASRAQLATELMNKK